MSEQNELTIKAAHIPMQNSAISPVVRVPSEQERLEFLKKIYLKGVTEAMLQAPLAVPEKFVGKDSKQLSTYILTRLRKNLPLTWEEACYCMEQMELDALVELSHKVTRRMCPKEASLCSISNIKSGACSQNCQWCAQSAHFDTNAPVYGLNNPDKCLNEAKLSYDQGVELFSMVASGRKINRYETAQLTLISDHIKKHIPDLKLCASLGLIDIGQVRILKRHGIERYHCNLETAPSKFHELVTTHSIIDKLQTIIFCKIENLDVCSGGIIGMGESARQRVELAWTLSQLEITSIPINLLHPIPGTPLANQPRLSDEEILRTIAIFRLLNPTAYLRFAGGRALLSDELVDRAIYTGINAAIVGDLLTTVGSSVADDRKRFKRHRYILKDIPKEKAIIPLNADLLAEEEAQKAKEDSKEA